MKKLILFLLLLFSIHHSFSQVTVELQNLKVNGQPVNSAIINFNGSQTVNITCDVKLSTSNGSTNNTFGNLYFFFTSANFTAPYQVSFQSVTFTPPFGDITKYTADFYSLSVTLHKSNFTSTGGTFYAQYKNNSGSIYKSSIYSVIDNTGVTDPGNPPGPPSYSEVVPFGGIPILGYIPAPDSWFRYDWINMLTGNIYSGWDDPDLKIISQTSPLYSIQGIGQVKIGRFDLQTNQYDSFYGNTTYTIHCPTPFTFDYSSGQKKNYRRIGVSNKISTTKEYLVPTYTNGIINFNSMRPSEIIGDQATVTRSGVTDGITQTFDVNDYQWQRRILRPYVVGLNGNPIYEQEYKWENIPNATNANYTPPFIKTGHRDAMQYRRLVHHRYDNSQIYASAIYASASSNVITIYPISVSSTINNTICCDAEYYLSDIISPIIGSTPLTEYVEPNQREPYKYQWQEGITRNGVLIWTNIENSNTKDFLPSRSGMRINEVIQYRRFVITENYKFYLSDPVEISFYKFANASRTEQEPNENTEPKISVYPNQTSSIITVKGENSLSSFNIKIIDINGKVLISQEPNSIEINSLEMDLTSIPSGIYTLILEDGSNTITKKIIKK